jgi:hypothetical protein
MVLKTFVPGEMLTAADVNLYLENNLVAVKAATESITSSVTLQDDDELFVPVAANSTYEINNLIRMDGATAGDFNFQYTGPAGAAFSAQVHRLISTAASISDDVIDSMEALSTPMAAGCLGAGSTTPVRVEGILVVGGTAGTFRLQWAQLAGSVTATRVLLRSYLVARRIA